MMNPLVLENYKAPSKYEPDSRELPCLPPLSSVDCAVQLLLGENLEGWRLSKTNQGTNREQTYS